MPTTSLRFVVSPVFIPFDAFPLPHPSGAANASPSPVKVWAALAAQRARVLYGRAENLAHLMSQLRVDFLQGTPNPTALMLQPDEIWAGVVDCQAHWGPEDIEAECWLEAAAALQLPVTDLALDFEVHPSAQGNWLAHCWACPLSMAKAYLAQLSELGLQLNTITCATQSNELGQAWRFQPNVMAEAFRLPFKGELASQYFSVFKEDPSC